MDKLRKICRHQWKERFNISKSAKFKSDTVPLKGKLPLKARNSRLDPHVSKLERFKFRDAKIQSWDAGIQSWVSMIEDPRS